MRRAIAVAATLVACRAPPPSDPPDPSASPQAKAEPAPIASPPSPPSPGAVMPATSASGAPVAPPLPLRSDEAVPFEPLAREPAHELTARELKELPPVYALAMALRASDVAPPPKGADLSAPGVEAARHKSEPSLAIDFTPGHARVALQAGFVLPEGTQLRVRADRLGYVVVSPDGESYRVAASGALRAIIGEGLFEVAPSSPPEVTLHTEGARRLGRATRRVEVTTRAARASFELVHLPDAGDAGALVCRLFLDLMSALPGASLCAEGDVPLHVEITWSAQPREAPGGRARTSGVSVFDAVSLARRAELVPAATFSTPPPGARFVPTGEPVRGAHLFLARADLAAMHLGPGEANAVLSLRNSTDELRFAWLDGVPLAWLAPGAPLDVTGLPRARVTIQWRTFLGDAIDPGELVTPPAMVDALPQPGGPVSASDSPPP